MRTAERKTEADEKPEQTCIAGIDAGAHSFVKIECPTISFNDRPVSIETKLSLFRDQIGLGRIHAIPNRMKIAVFLERDGVLNNALADMTPRSFKEFRVNNDVAEPLSILREAGFLLIATTNQPGLSRGDLPRRDLDLMHTQLQRQLPLDDILVCPHLEEDDCPCRKPRAGLMQEASFAWHVELDRSYVISDKWQDAEAAHQAGCISMLINSPRNGSGHHDYILEDIDDAVEKILHIEQSRSALAERHPISQV
jgi:D-glycero-D-manno-heptose 1,7-bisphosphate phosphatase